MDLSFNTHSVVSPSTFALGPMPIVEPVALVKVSGATLMHVASATPATCEAALKTLREYRAIRRRVVWCNPTDLARTPRTDLRAWGRNLVELGHADMVVACGLGARELALAVRDAGLSIGRVVVCTDDATARNVLTDSIVAGDTILALGTTSESCYKLAERLETRFERELLVAN